MIEFLLGVLLTPWMLAGLLIASVFFEHKECRGWVVFLTISAVVITYILCGLQPIHLAYAALAWIPIGIIWAMWRWKRHCARVVNETDTSDEWSVNRAKEKLNPTENKSTLVYWVWAWPISMVDMTMGDVYDLIENLITKVFKGTFAKISLKANDDLDARVKNAKEENKKLAEKYKNGD